MLALSYMSSSEDKTTTWSISNIREHGEGSETPSPALCCLEATIQWQGGCLFINSCVLSRPFWGGTLSITLGITLKPQYKSLFPPPFWIWVCKKKKRKEKDENCHQTKQRSPSHGLWKAPSWVILAWPFSCSMGQSRATTEAVVGICSDFRTEPSRKMHLSKCPPYCVIYTGWLSGLMEL